MSKSGVPLKAVANSSFTYMTSTLEGGGGGGDGGGGDKTKMKYYRT